MTVRTELRRAFTWIQHWASTKKGKSAPPGTRNWLVEREVRYGGRISGVLRQQYSEHDDRVPSGEIGGDRMSPRYHGYAKSYQKALAGFLNQQGRVVLAELGILRGTGLAIWADLFPQGRIIGLDIDLSNFDNNYNNLVSLGAFKANVPEVYLYDGFVDNRNHLKNLLNGDQIDIFIDDASHNSNSILTTFHSVKCYLAENFVYVVEDNRDIAANFRDQYPEYSYFVSGCGQLTIITPEL